MAKELIVYNGEKIVSSINSVGKTGQPHAKEWNYILLLYYTQKSTQMDYRLEYKT